VRGRGKEGEKEKKQGRPHCNHSGLQEEQIEITIGRTSHGKVGCRERKKYLMAVDRMLRRRIAWMSSLATSAQAQATIFWKYASDRIMYLDVMYRYMYIQRTRRRTIEKRSSLSQMVWDFQCERQDSTNLSGLRGINGTATGELYDKTLSQTHGRYT